MARVTNSRKVLLSGVFILMCMSGLNQLHFATYCGDVRIAREHRKSNSMVSNKGVLVRRHCGNHKPSTTYVNSYNLTVVEVTGRIVDIATALDSCEELCEGDLQCTGWTFQKVSTRLGYCRRFDTLRQGHPNEMYTSGVCESSWTGRVVGKEKPLLLSEAFRGLGFKGPPRKSTWHFCMIFDGARIQHATGFVKSLRHFSDRKQHLAAHLVVPGELLPQLQSMQSIRGEGIDLYFYDMDLCVELIRDVRPIAPHLHVAPLCKTFLSEILPVSVEIVTFVDNDAVVVQNPATCFEQVIHAPALVAMAFDMGENCQSDPESCWPLSHEWEVTPGLRCGTTPERAERLRRTGRAKVCNGPGSKEPIQFNAGVILYHLSRMRATNFTERLVNLTHHTARMAGEDRPAKWGDQEFLANYFRFHPEALQLLPCGCNYQWTAARRMIKCPNQPVYIGHGWHAGTAKLTPDPYNKLFFHFKHCEKDSDVAPPYPIAYTPTRNCPHQTMTCDEDLSIPLFRHDVVNVLTRTALRPNFFREARSSVMAQTHRYIKHVILTDDPDSLTYITGDQIIEIPSRYNEFDAMEPCDRCGASPAKGCGNAPYEPAARIAFLDCYCQTSYPMNGYVDVLNTQARQGWVVYLDDDNMFLNPYGLSLALIHARSTSDLILWRAKLGRMVPLPEHWAASKVYRGDIDSANFMFHTSHKGLTRWGDTRCGDFRTVSSLSNVLHLRWLNRSVIGANPMRQALGGLGLRGEFGSKVTVVITSCTTKGFRPTWLRRTIEEYLSEAYRTVIHRVILVWNTPEEEVPVLPNGVHILRMKSNSLNHRWTKIAEHVQTAAVLNLDDDVFVNKVGIVCLMNWWSLHKDQLVGPFVRKNDGYKLFSPSTRASSGCIAAAEVHIMCVNRYVIDELFGEGKHYTLMLPRIMMLSSEHLLTYRMLDAEIREYVDTQKAHCDDITLNAAVAKKIRKPPFRVLLPLGSVVDYYATCWKNFKADTAGLGLQDKRSQLRSDCIKWILQKFGGEDVLHASSDVGSCDYIGSRLRPGVARSATADNWMAMSAMSDESNICRKG